MIESDSRNLSKSIFFVFTRVEILSWLNLVLKTLKNRKNKNFLFSFHGWSKATNKMRRTVNFYHFVKRKTVAPVSWCIWGVSSHGQDSNIFVFPFVLQKAFNLLLRIVKDVISSPDKKRINFNEARKIAYQR